MKYFTCLVLVAVSFTSCSRTQKQPQTDSPRSEARQISPKDSKASEPAIAAAKNGDVYLLYVEHRGDEGADVFLQTLDVNGKAKGERSRVNNEPGIATAWRGDPPTIGTSEDGTIFVGWNRKYTDAKGNDLVLSVSCDAGRTFGVPVKVNDDIKPASHGMHSLAVDETGRVIVAWLDERNIKTEPHKMETGAMMHHEDTEPNSEVFTAVSDDGGKTFSKNVRIAEDVCPCCKTALLASADDGTVYLSWRQVLKGDHRHIAVAASTDGGVQFSPAVIVSNDKWQISACPVSGSALISNGKSEVDVVWYTAGAAGQPGVYTASSTDGGKTFGERRMVSELARGGTPACGAGSCAFVAGDGNVRVQSLVPNKPKQTDLINASAPAAIFTTGKTLVTFVRTVGDSPAVWTDTIAN